MKHAVLGAGGVGGLIAALLAQCGEQVTLIVRPQARAAQPDRKARTLPVTQTKRKCGQI